MLELIGALVALAAAPGAVSPPLDGRAGCPEHGVRLAGERERAAVAAGARRLGDLPPADLVLTVLRTVDRCPVPVIVRSNIGGR